MVLADVVPPLGTQVATLGSSTQPDLDDLDGVVAQGLTVTDWVAAGITLVGFLVVARIVRAVIVRLVERTDAEGNIGLFVGRLIQNLIVLVGFVYALSVLEVQIGPLLGALGITGLAIAFAMTAILENVFASVLLKTRRPIKVGDEISTNGHSGVLVDVNFRTVVLRNFDGERVVLPSSLVANDVIVNHTTEGLRRTVLPVGVAYGTDLQAAQRIILDAVGTVEGVHDAPAPQAWVTTFGESSIDFDVRFWHEPPIATLFRVRSETAMAIKRGFDEAGVEIPFPQRVVTMAEPPADPSTAPRAAGAGG